MLVSLNWLKELTPYDGPSDQLAHTLTMRGLEVEEQFKPFARLQDLVTGRVVDCQPHPNADKLSLCQVDVGQEASLQIVCGAPNVQAGQCVAVAPVGVTLPDGMKIKRTKIRKVLSEGMICSEKELQLGEDHSGIMVLEHAFPPGTGLLKALNLDDLIFDIGITPNRADCLSILGVAREVAAAFSLPLTPPDPELTESEPATASQVTIAIDDPDLCPLYQARIIQGVDIGPSPAWMRYRLLSMGVRPINSIVDVTNYVLLELGHPLHAFDADLLEGKTVRVARARDHQRLVTLDEQERILSRDDLLIWDGTRPVALAGVMGGQNSEISSGSDHVLLECAVFHPGTVRKTARRLNLSSEASYRFERGVDQGGADLATDRAASLIQRLTGGRVLSGIARNEPRPLATDVPIVFRPERARQLLALDVDSSFCARSLKSLGCSLANSGPEQLTVTPPSYRLDLEREVDLIEEIGRVYGLENVPETLPRIAKPLHRPEPVPVFGPQQPSYEFMKQIKIWAQGLGFLEAVNYSFVGAAELEKLGLHTSGVIPVQNPLSADQDSLRPALAPGLLQSLESNLNQGHQDLRLFEVARTFEHHPESETTALERTALGLVLHGRRHPETWPWEDQPVDYHDIKGVIEHLLTTLGLDAPRWVLLEEHPFLFPAVAIELSGEVCGHTGQLKTEQARDYRARTPVWMAELHLDTLYALSCQGSIAYRPWPKFPPVHRDMTLIGTGEVAFESIIGVIDAAAVPVLESCTLADIYQPEGSAERSLTLRMTYRHPSKTLTDREVDKQHSRLGQLLIDALPLRFP